MSKEREALKLTLEALKKMESRFGCESSRAEEQPKTFACHHMAETCPRCEGLVSGWKAVQAANQAIAAAEKVLAQSEQKHWGSYVYGRVFVGNLPEHVRKLAEDEGVAIQLLYTTPPQRKPLDFGDFFEWANNQGYDTAHTHDGAKWICLNPMTNDLWKAWQASHLGQLTHYESGMTSDELWLSNGKLRAELADLKVQRKTLTDAQKDAARYRFLRNYAHMEQAQNAWRSAMTNRAEAMDEYIDRAIEAACDIKE